jgi:hypothetical protein
MKRASGRLDSVPYLGLLLVSSGLDGAVQSGSGNLEGPGDLRNEVTLVLEIKGNVELSCRQDLGSAAFFPSGSGGNKSCCCSLPNQISLKFSECAKDMKDQLSSAGCGINILGQAFKPNPPLLKGSHGGNQIRKESAQHGAVSDKESIQGA